MLPSYWHESVIGVLGLLCVGVFARGDFRRRADRLLYPRKVDQAEEPCSLLSGPSLSPDRWHGQRMWQAPS